MNTREMIRQFNLAFGRPVNNSLTQLTVTERELLGKLLLEETLEYIEKGLGLEVYVDAPGLPPLTYRDYDGKLDVRLNEGQFVNPVECADGLGDVNVVIHFAAHWQGFNLDAVTEAINESNMSKLGEDGKPIINAPQIDEDGVERLIDPTKPVGKILKGPNFREPFADIMRIIMTENGNG